MQKPPEQAPMQDRQGTVDHFYGERGGVLVARWTQDRKVGGSLPRGSLSKVLYSRLLHLTRVLIGYL